MSPLTRDEFIELGISVRTDRLIKWARRQLSAAGEGQARLKSRGVDAAYLARIEDLIGTIENAPKNGGEGQDLPPEAAALAELVRDEAAAFWREAKLIAKAEFGTSPDDMAKFRTGVQTGRLLPNLTKELESILAMLREHTSRLARLGGTEGFIENGERLVKRLKEVKASLDTVCRALPPSSAQRCHDKGLLYDLTRTLVRTAQLAFMHDPAQQAPFNFTGVGRKSGVSTQPRPREEGIGGRK